MQNFVSSVTALLGLFVCFSCKRECQSGNIATDPDRILFVFLFTAGCRRQGSGSLHARQSAAEGCVI